MSRFDYTGNCCEWCGADDRPSCRVCGIYPVGDHICERCYERRNPDSAYWREVERLAAMGPHKIGAGIAEAAAAVRATMKGEPAAP
jgi:hypothetical protein